MTKSKAAAPKPKKSATKEPKKPEAKKARDPASLKAANGGLSGMQALALWKLILEGDGKNATAVGLTGAEAKGLESENLVTFEGGKRKADPAYGAKLHVTDEGWAWANRRGFKMSFPNTKAAVPVLEELLGKVGAYLQMHDLALASLLRPRKDAPEPEAIAAATPTEGIAPASTGAAPEALEERIRTAYLRVTGGALNEHVKLAQLRAELRGEAIDAVDEELRQMQQRGTTVLYPIDDPRRLRPEDEAAALRVAGQRRDLVCITR
jgi:hypothetical protein